MLNGARAKSIRQDHIGGGYLVTQADGKSLRYCGLLDTLATTCFPDYDYDEAKKIAATPATLRSATGLSRPWHGVQRGRVLHNQVRAFVNGGGIHAVSGMFSNTANDQTRSLALCFIDSLATLRLKPVRAEFALYYEHIALASSIDLLCTYTDPITGAVSLSIVEIKCGYENNFADGSAPLVAPPQLRLRYNNSPRTQAFLQLAFYRQMVRHTYPAVTLGPCYVAQVRTKETLYHRLPSDIIDASESLVEHVGAQRLSVLQHRAQQPVVKRGRGRRRRRGAA